jgi:hypothetical protein
LILKKKRIKLKWAENGEEHRSNLKIIIWEAMLLRLLNSREKPKKESKMGIING